MSPSGLVVQQSKIAWIAWIIPQAIAWCAVIQLILSEYYYSLIACILLIITYTSFKKWRQAYRINPIVSLKQVRVSNPIFWILTFKEGQTQKIELTDYYRTAFLIILIYKPFYSPKSRSGTYTLFYDALSQKHYRALAAALWSG